MAQPNKLKWISVKWASEKAFAHFFCSENNYQWSNEKGNDNNKFFIVKREKAAYFEFECSRCGHTWSTKFGTFKFYIAFKIA